MDAMRGIGLTAILLLSLCVGTAHAQSAGNGEFVSICMGVSQLQPSDAIAERKLRDGSIKIYRVVDLREMVEDYVQLMTKEYGWTEEQARREPFGNIKLAKETLCGGTKNCGSKTCRSSGRYCEYRGGGMSGCACVKGG